MGADEATEGGKRDTPSTSKRWSPIVRQVLLYIIAWVLVGALSYVAVVSWSIPWPVVALADAAVAVGVTYPFLRLRSFWVERASKNPAGYAKVGAIVLFVIALIITSDLCIVGFWSWPKPIIAATGLAIGLGSTFLFLLAILVSKSEQEKSELLRQFLRDDHDCPSLARLQFFSWTALVIFVFAWITLIRILSGVPAFSGSFPPNVLGILTISTGSTVVASHIESTASPSPSVIEKLKAWSSLLDEVSSEGEKVHPSLARFQMLGWTVISIGIYVTIIFLEVYHVWISGSAAALTLPDLDPTLLVLMGISQSGYLGAKYVTYDALKNGKKDDKKSTTSGDTSQGQTAPAAQTEGNGDDYD